MVFKKIFKTLSAEEIAAEKARKEVRTVGISEEFHLHTTFVCLETSKFAKIGVFSRFVQATGIVVHTRTATGNEYWRGRIAQYSSSTFIRAFFLFSIAGSILFGYCCMHETKHPTWRTEPTPDLKRRSSWLV